MIPAASITGIVLAGGDSTRFGSNKALAIWNEQTLLERSVELIRPYCRDVLISGDYPAYETLQCKKIPDLLPDLGPLGGIYTAFKHTDTPYLLFLTCDMPLMNRSLIERLITDDPLKEVTLWQEIEGTLQLFPSLFSRNILQWIEGKIRRKELSIRSILSEVSFRLIPVRQKDEKAFLNVNHAEDLNELIKYAPS